MPPTSLQSEPEREPSRQYSLKTLFYLTLAIAVQLRFRLAHLSR